MALPHNFDVDVLNKIMRETTTTLAIDSTALQLTLQLEIFTKRSW